MSETTAAALLVANFEPAQVAALSFETRNSFMNQMEKSGYSRDDIMGKLGTEAERATWARLRGHEPAATESSTAAPVVETVDSREFAALTKAETHALAANLAKHWTGPPEQLEAALKAAGYVAPKESAEGEGGLHPLLNGVGPEQYELNGLYVNRPIPGGAEAAHFDRDLRTGLAEMGFPAAMGRGLAEAALESSLRHEARVARHSDPAKAEAAVRLNWEHQKMLISRAFAGKPYSEILQLAKYAIDRSPMVRSSPNWVRAFESAQAFTQLARHGERLLARSKGKK